MNKFSAIFAVLFGAAWLVASLAGEAQSPQRIYRVGILAGAVPVADLVGATPRYPPIRAFVSRLGELGYIYGTHFVTEARSAEGRPERISSLVDDLLRQNVDVMVVPIRDGVRAAKDATFTVPIVMVGIADPVGLGLVSSLARPGRNITGISRDAGPEIVGKRMELLREAFPQASRVGVLTTKSHWTYSGTYNEAAARALRVNVIRAEADTPEQYDDAFDKIIRERVDAFIAAEGALNFTYRQRIVDFAASRRLPAMHAFRESVEDGGLMALAVETTDLYIRAAVYVDKILKGAKPAELPVEQPTKFEFLINMKAARALRLDLPKSLLQRATEIIE